MTASLPPAPNLARRVLSGTAWAFAMKLLGMASGLVANGLLARMLAPDELGAYFLVASVAMFAAVLARFGMKQTVVRLVAESMAMRLPGRAAASLAIVYAITTLGVIAVAGAYVLGAGAWLARSAFEMPLLTTVTGLTAIWIAVLAFQTPIAETFRGLHDIRLAVLLDGVLASAMLAATLTALWHVDLPLDFARAVLVTVIVAAISLLSGTFLFARRARVFRGRGDIRAGAVVRISAPLFVSNLANQGMTNASLWVVAAYASAEQVALYGAAWKLVAIVSLPLLLVNMTVQPVIAELYTKDEKARLENCLRGTATLAGIPAAGVLLVFLLFGEDVLALVYGAPYRDAVLLLVLLSAGQLANVWAGSCSQVLAFTGHQRQLMMISIVTGIASVAAMLTGAAHWGVPGVAAATAAGLAFSNLLVWLMVRRLTGLWTHGTLSPRFISMAAAQILRRPGRGRN